MMRQIQAARQHLKPQECELRVSTLPGVDDLHFPGAYGYSVHVPYQDLLMICPNPAHPTVCFGYRMEYTGG
jgi:hypothetical protein